MSTSREVFDKLNKTKKLPSPSGTTLRVIQLCHDEGASLNDIADVIQVDPALSAALLKYANAFYLTTGRQVVSVQKAAVKLGLKTVVNLALGLSLLADNRKGKCKTFDYDRFWSMSLLQAIAAKNVAAVDRRDDPEEIFICALLCRMGQLAFATIFPEEYGDILHRSDLPADGGPAATDPAVLDKSPTLKRKKLEKERFAIDSSELTAELFLDWGLPAHYALAAGFHDDPNCLELGTGKTQRIAQLLNLAHQLAESCLQVSPDRGQLGAVETAAVRFDISAGRFGAIFDTIIAQWQESGEALEIRTGPCPLYADIMGKD